MHRLTLSAFPSVDMTASREIKEAMTCAASSLRDLRNPRIGFGAGALKTIENTACRFWDYIADCVCRGH